jgi:hypothetical protein
VGDDLHARADDAAGDPPGSGRKREGRDVTIDPEFRRQLRLEMAEGRRHAERVFHPINEDDLYAREMLREQRKRCVEPTSHGCRIVLGPDQREGGTVISPAGRSSWL